MRVLTPILRNLLLHPARTFVHDDQRAWSGAAMLVASLRLASLIDRETEDGPIGLLLPTSGLFPIGIIAGWMLGRPLVPINYLLKPEHLQHVVRDSGMTAIVGVDPMRSFAEPIADDPVILHANQHALANGSRVERCLRCAEAVARRFDIPFLVMSYYDILLFRTSPPCSTPTSRAASLPRACRSRSASA